MVLVTIAKCRVCGSDYDRNREGEDGVCNMCRAVKDWMDNDPKMQAFFHGPPAEDDPDRAPAIGSHPETTT